MAATSTRTGTVLRTSTKPSRSLEHHAPVHGVRWWRELGWRHVVAVVGDGDAAEVARTLAGRVGDVAHAGEADRTIVPARLREIAAV